MNNNFVLGLYDTGAGVTACDRSRYENGDYKKLAFIHDNGRLDWYIKPDGIPGDALLKIERAADTRAEFFRDNWNKKSLGERLYIILDIVLTVPALDAILQDIKKLSHADAVSKYEYFILERRNIETASGLLELYKNHGGFKE